MFFLVYFNTLVLIPRLLLKGKTIVYSVGILSTIATYTVLRSLYTQYSFYLLFEQEQPEPITNFIWLSFVYGIWFAVISSMLYITHTWYEQKQKLKATQIGQLQTELKYLRAQLNPHFLFNGLNTIYGSIDKENQQAREVLLQFSDLLRYSIYETDFEFVPLEKEIRYLENYVALQKVRSNPNVKIELDIKVEDAQTPVAPMLFIPMVENAFKFVTREDQRENYVTIVLTQSANSIRFICRNSCDAMPQTAGGIGLANIRRRLDLLYPEKHQLSIEKTNTDYTIDLKLLP
jgi:LytS/YehU family sensor histidine kinase